MVNDANGYTNVYGDYITTTTLLTNQIANLQSRIDSGESKLTDINIGSELRNIFEATDEVGLQYLKENDALGRMHSVTQAVNTFLEDRAFEVGLNRKQGTAANGICTFSINTPSDVDYPIFRNTAVLSRINGNRYYLSEDIVIKAGDTWATGLVFAESLGEDYNCNAGDITAIDTSQGYRSDLSVYNDYAFSNGSDAETDDEFRVRILAAMKGGRFGSWQWYKTICEDITGVHDVKFVKPEHLNAIEPFRHSYINSDNQEVQCNDCTAVCIINGNDGGSGDSLILEVANLLTNQYNIVLGHEFHVQLAKRKEYMFKISFYPEPNTTVLESEIKECLDVFFDGGTYEGIENITYTGTNIGEVVKKSAIIDALENMENLHHVESIKLVRHHSTFTDEIARLTSWINDNDNDLYDYDDNNPFTYSSLLDFPDEDDDEYQSIQYTEEIPSWKFIETITDSENVDYKLYELSLDGYRFYKKVDNEVQDDSNIGELAINEYMPLGEKTFNTLTPEEDSVAKIGYIGSYDDISSVHFVELEELTEEDNDVRL